MFYLRTPQDRRGHVHSRWSTSRKDDDVNFHWVLESGGAMVGDRVAVQLEIEAILQPPSDGRPEL